VFFACLPVCNSLNLRDIIPAHAWIFLPVLSILTAGYYSRLRCR
jgi:hypothetical protein